MKIKRFEELECWKEARLLVKSVYKWINESEKLKKDFELKNQIVRAAVSVMSNIAEGFSRKSKKEFIQFLYISKASASELQSLLYVALDQDYIDEKTFQEIYEQADKVSQINSGLIKYLTSQLKERNNAITRVRNNAITRVRNNAITRVRNNASTQVHNYAITRVRNNAINYA